jgi:uncharacterized protein (DUF488 family)
MLSTARPLVEIALETGFADQPHVTRPFSREMGASPAAWRRSIVSESSVERDSPVGTVFSVGHSTRPIEQFVDLLQAYKIECVADIRSVPRSRHNPQFNADVLGPTLALSTIDYQHVTALGGLRRAQRDSPNQGWRNESFRGFADYLQSQGFEVGLEQLISMSRNRRVAMMCAEAVPWRCHRSLVADALLVRLIPVVEILSETSSRVHSLTPFAHVEGTRITYPPEQLPLC